MLRRHSKKGRYTLFCAAMLMGALLLAGCSGSKGSTGETGEQGPAGDTGPAGPAGEDATAAVEPEACAICHNGTTEPDGVSHQMVYDDYADASAFNLTIDSVGTVGANSTLTFTVTKNGAAYIDAGLANTDQKRYYAAAYDSATRKVTASFSYGSPVSQGNGVYTVTTSSATFAPENTNAFVYAYVADGGLQTEGMQLYDDVANAGREYGNVDTYTSVANVSACEACHGAPYMKHGYRAATVAGLPDFVACKACHVDANDGGHEDWQILADDPDRFAEIFYGADLTAAEETKYAYKRSVMNDVHMSHAMEFPYPQSMRNCVTCHEGNLAATMADANFVLETCQSCHAVDGLAEKVPHNIPDPAVQKCNVCHIGVGGGIAPAFVQIHTGYDPEIYAADGTRYSDAFKVTINSASLDANNVLTFQFTAHENIDLPGLAVTDVAPSVLIGLYGYNSKDFIVSSHGRTVDDDRDLEWTVGAAGDSNARFTTVSAGDGKFTVRANLSAWADRIDAGSIRRAEIAIRPVLQDADGTTVAINSPSRTFDLAANAFDDDYYTPIVDAANCNVCHDALATSFHSADRAGNVVTCRICHVGLNGGSHLEMQSRSIDSYVHAIHSFQAFDPGDIDFGNLTESMAYDLHIEHTYPNFTILNCESCHNPGTYDVPDQSKSMAGILSASDQNDTWDRNIGTVPSYVTGPASRACGSCHRADLINEDLAGDLATFNSHTSKNGYLIEDGDGVLEETIEEIMSLFN